MPFVDLNSGDDYASIWYTTNSPFGNVGGFCPEKPTVVLLHPMFLDSSWLHYQFSDRRLNSEFNLIAVDMRVCGKSTSRPSGRHDSWVEAADLARVHCALHLPPSHILAHEGLSTNCALRFASLFPEMCISLTLVNVPPPTELKAAFHAYDELLKDWCYATDLDSFEHTGMEAAKFVAGQDCDPDLLDELICYWERVAPPFRRQRILEMENVILNRTPLSAKVYAAITQPVLIVQGERNETAPVQYAHKLAEDLVNAEGGAIVYTVKGASACLCLMSSTSSITNQVFVKFVSRLGPVRSDIRPPAMHTYERMHRALQLLADITEDPSIANRDPMCSLSFSCLSLPITKSQTEGLVAYGKKQWKALCPLQIDGRPMRRYSDRKDGHWFDSELDGLSYAGSNIVAPPQQGGRRPEPERPEPVMHLPKTEPISSGTAQDGRLRRTTFNVSSVDKVVLKGSVTKVIAAPPTIPLHRLVQN